MTRLRLTRDVRQLAFAVCLGIPLITLLILIGSKILLSTFDERSSDMPEHTGSFVCISDVAGTLLLCEESYSAPWTSDPKPLIVGNTTS